MVLSSTVDETRVRHDKSMEVATGHALRAVCEVRNDREVDQVELSLINLAETELPTLVATADKDASRHIKHYCVLPSTIKF